MATKPKLKTQKVWGIESPKHGILPFPKDFTRLKTSQFVACEKGRRVVRVTMTWQARKLGGTCPCLD